MYLFKVHKRKNWHIGRTHSFCHNAKWGDKFVLTKDKKSDYPFNPEYAERMEVDHIPLEIHDNICKACVMHAYAKKKIIIDVRKK